MLESSMLRASPRALIQRVGETAGEAVMLTRFTRDLAGFLGTPLSVEEAHRRIRQRLANREAMLLSSVKRAIYQHSRSPYLALLRHAGCELGDLDRLVRQEGIEGALANLAARGVYVTFDELKGRRVAVRGSARFHFSPRDFDSPLHRAHYVTYTGGSRGRPVRVPRHFQYVEELASSRGASFAAFGVINAPHIYWLTNPMTTMLIGKKVGEDTRLWVHPLRTFPWKGKIAARYLEFMGRIVGSRFPRPRLLEVDQAERLVRWLMHQPDNGRPWVVDAIPSSAVRMSLAARELGVRLDGVTFALQSEPLTDARHRHIVEAGARALVSYTSIEMSTMAGSCGTANAADDLHVFTDRYAVIERERPIVEDGPEIRAMLITTLTDAVATVSFNTEPGDYAQIERRGCDCSLGTLGLTTHVSRVRSFEKLSGEGVTFARTNLMRTLEEVLPARFGGSALDYQLIEDEAPDSSTRLTLRIHPSVGALDEEEARAALLEDLGRGGIVDRNHAELLRRAGSVRISREPPLATTAGKVLPFQLRRL
jgi:phenylacetate-coenzyme A ligase PaaK-like adenylate-forming protein